MLTIEQAQERILAQLLTLSAEPVLLVEAFGRVLSEGVVAPADVPAWDNSAMDGYAVRAADTATAGVDLRLLEVVGAGSVATTAVGPGTAVAVMTGAPVPPGADAVVMFEDTDRALQGTLRVRVRVSVGANVRPRGQDVQRGSEVLAAGHTLTPAAVGLAASLGHTHVPCRRRPVVAILGTGDEIVTPGLPLPPGHIYASNGVALAGLVVQAGGIARDLGAVPDDVHAIGEALARASDADVVLSTGGVSVGLFDHVKEAYQRLGIAVDFWKVNMKPGKPLAFGWLDRDGRRVPLFGLPGNPVSSLVNFLQFVRPYLRASLGDPTPYLPVVDAVAGHDFSARPGRAKLLRVELQAGPTGWVATATGTQSSGALSSMVRAHGLLLVGIDRPAPSAGDRVRVQLFGSGFLAGAQPAYGW